MCVHTAAKTAGDGISGDNFDANAQERALQQSILTASQQKKISKKQKPAWAYTEESKVQICTLL